MRVLLSDVTRAKMQEELAKQVTEQIDGHDTICNHIRALHRLCTTEEQRALCEEIVYLAKRMNDALLRYKNGKP